MPEPPDVNLFTRYVLENPWPLGLGLLAVAAWLFWTGAREGLLKKLKYAAACAALGFAVLLIGYFVITSGERARVVTRNMVDAAVAGDVVAAMNLFTPDAAFALASPKNPGFDIEFIETQLIRLANRYRIESNTITMLRGYSESSTHGVVHLACYTTVDGYPNLSRWALRVRREPNGEWKIAHLTCVEINGRAPAPERLW